MKVLRSNKDSVMAMLEAFVYDPLINWRLLNTTDATSDIVTTREVDSKEGGHPPFPFRAALGGAQSAMHGQGSFAV